MGKCTCYNFLMAMVYLTLNNLLHTLVDSNEFATQNTSKW